MTTKPSLEKREGEQQPLETPSPEDIQKAYQLHTLIQMMYAQMVAANPWGTSMPAVSPWGVPAQPMGSCGAQPTPMVSSAPMPRMDPTWNCSTPPWFVGASPSPSYPFGWGW